MTLSLPGTLTILVIDDHEPMRKVTREGLEAAGFQVVVADGGAAGIEAARSHLPDVIVCDISMPDIDGHAVLASLRADSSTVDIPLIFLTGEDTRAAQRRGMEEGADDYVTKPFSIQEVLQSVHTQIRKHSSARERSQKALDELRHDVTRMLPHELLTPLSPIVGYAEILRSPEGLTTVQLAQIGDDIAASARRLERLVRNVLFYADLEILRKGPRVGPDPRPVRASAILKPIKAGVEKAISRASRQADLTMEMENLSVAMLEEHIEVIAEELTDNACKFSTPGTSIVVRASRERDYIKFSVTDHGRGMTLDEIRSFGAYLQFRRSCFEQQGSGLGLIIVKRVVELSGGRLVLRSIPGHETAAEAYVPIASS